MRDRSIGRIYQWLFIILKAYVVIFYIHCNKHASEGAYKTNLERAKHLQPIPECAKSQSLLNVQVCFLLMCVWFVH